MILNTTETIGEAIDTFKLDSLDAPDLVPLGLPPLDKELGGLGPGALGVLAAGTGTGKSSAMLAAMLASPVKVGAISAEDGPDVVGTRLLAALTGIDSLRLRRKALTKKDLKTIAAAHKSNQLDHMYFSYPLGGRIDRIETSMEEMAAAGCRLVWCDYLQCFSVPGSKDRRMEINELLSRIHEKAGDLKMAVMVVSQFRRVGEDMKTGKPRPVGIHHLKESGDIENKARIIVLATKQPSPDGDRVRFKLAKSTYGGEHVKFDMLRDDSGTLRHVHFYSPTEGM